jgi:hypothetical protein
MSMTLDNYQEQFSGAPMELRDFAIIARQVSDDEEFRGVAIAYLEAMEAFEQILAERDIVVG